MAHGLALRRQRPLPPPQPLQVQPASSHERSSTPCPFTDRAIGSSKFCKGRLVVQSNRDQSFDGNKRVKFLRKPLRAVLLRHAKTEA